MIKDYKYTIRKLSVVLALALTITTPMLIAEYKSRTTTDPYILVAREVEAFGKSVDVLNVEKHRTRPNLLTVFVYVKDYPEWTVRQDQPNFNAAVLRAVARHGYTGALILIGWDFPPPDFRVQGLYMCEELRRSSCFWERVSNVQLTEEFIQWPGIGNP